MDLIRLTRPVDFPLFVAAVALGGWLGVGSGASLAPVAGRLTAAAIAAALVGLGANVVNDMYDVEIDRKNAPHRPLPSGRVSIRSARWLWLGLSAAGVTLAFFASPLHGLIAAAGVAFLWLYAARLKRLAGVGHLVVGLTLAAAVVYGALVVEPRPPAPVLAAAGLALLLVSVREVVKAIPDIEGDQEIGAGTVPTVLGAAGASRVAVAGMMLAIGGIPLIAAVGYDTMLLAYTLPMAALLLAAVWTLLSVDALRRAGRQRWSVCARRASGLMKAALAMGVIALAVAR